MKRKDRRPSVIDQMKAIKAVAKELRALERNAAAGDALSLEQVEHTVGRCASTLERAFAGKAAA